ncbi:MAG: hypothetical protein U9Q81_22475 [Pseudomonadota bacterium]|nr:hypothetical protein [Pseudomonadota bacterium]
MRVHLETVPKGVELRVGRTASVLVMTRTNGYAGKQSAGAAPR